MDPDILFIICVVLFAVVYFLPTFIAMFRDRTNTMAIFTLNILLGWTFLGWVGALIWSVLDDPYSL